MLLKIAIEPCFSILQSTPVTQDCNIHLFLKIAIYPCYSRLQSTPVSQDFLYMSNAYYIVQNI